MHAHRFFSLSRVRRMRLPWLAVPMLTLIFADYAAAQTDVSGAAPTSASQNAQQASAKNLADWRAAMRQNHPPKKGCFTSAYPSQEWQEVPCTTAPQRPYLPARGPRVVGGGGGNDASAQVVSGTISQAVGSFDSVTGVTSESGDGNANAFSLQLNTNTFTTPTCANATDPNCRGWQQFVYSNSAGSAFIQYWLLDYGEGCPPGFLGNVQQGHLDCFTNSVDAASVPQQDITNLANLSITGIANSGGLDGLLMQVGSTLYAVSIPDNALDLAPKWTTAEFNVFGDGNRSKAVFNSGATIVVRTVVDGAGSGAPFCMDESFTAETNNLNFASPPAAEAGLSPAVVFTESTSGSAALPCDSAVELGVVVPPTPTSPTGAIHTLTPTMTWTGGSYVNSVEVHILRHSVPPVVVLESNFAPASISSLVVPAGVLQWGVDYMWQVEACSGPNGPSPTGACLDNNSWTFFSTQQQFTITVAASPSGGGTVSGGGTFPALSTPTVTAAANSGYVFGSWTENGQVVSQNSASYQLPPLNANESLTANFLKTTTTTLTSAPDPSKFGRAVTFTARVTAPFGIVTFKDGPTTLGTAGLSRFTGSIARFATAKLKPGKHTITATYGGSPGFAASRSAVIQIVQGGQLAPRINPVARVRPGRRPTQPAAASRQRLGGRHWISSQILAAAYFRTKFESGHRKTMRPS
jgi:Bacterial Ig-like domain (group 3)/Divergent InlB B-repeat domain